jgi:hypothetical protein
MEDYSEDGIPVFNGSNNDTWNIRMRTHIQAEGFLIWKSVKDGYTPSKYKLKEVAGRKLHEANEKSLCLIISGLSQIKKERLNVCE